tara:strand:- start:89239 stop:89421 length:183 start_codon:yes stop_codon:yes gene_type:complete
MSRPYPFPAEAGIEPSLNELLNDPLMHKILARDGLTISDVTDVVRRWQLQHIAQSPRVAA